MSAAEALELAWVANVEKANPEPRVKSALLNMRNFQKKQVLIDVMLMHLVNKSVSKEEKDRLQDIFDSLDKNSDGRLSPEEISQGSFINNIRGFKSYLSSDNQLTQEEIQQIMRNLDRNDNGYMDYTGTNEKYGQNSCLLASTRSRCSRKESYHASLTLLIKMEVDCFREMR